MDDNHFLSGDLVLLERCDAVFMNEGWEKSIDARREMEYSMNTNLPIFLTTIS
jgi:hypothetical protein